MLKRATMHLITIRRNKYIVRSAKSLLRSVQLSRIRRFVQRKSVSTFNNDAVLAQAAVGDTVIDHCDSGANLLSTRPADLFVTSKFKLLTTTNIVTAVIVTLFFAYTAP